MQLGRSAQKSGKNLPFLPVSLRYDQFGGWFQITMEYSVIALEQKNNHLIRPLGSEVTGETDFKHHRTCFLPYLSYQCSGHMVKVMVPLKTARVIGQTREVTPNSKL